MKKLILVAFVFFFVSGCKGEKSVTDSDTAFKSNDYLTEVEKLPEIEGGIEAIQQNVKYPEEAKTKGIEGKVVVRIFLDENGKVNETEILKSDDSTLEKAAEDAVKMTKFTPGMTKGEPVKTQIVLPIVFKLSDNGSVEKKSNKYPEYNIEADEFPIPVGGISALVKNMVYPENEKKNGIQGKVLVLALISEAGDVVKTEILEGVNPALDKAAMEAIKKTKFTPAKKDGTRVKSQVQIPVNFKLQ